LWREEIRLVGAIKGQGLRSLPVSQWNGLRGLSVRFALRDNWDGVRSAVQLICGISLLAAFVGFCNAAAMLRG